MELPLGKPREAQDRLNGIVEHDNSVRLLAEIRSGKVRYQYPSGEGQYYILPPGFWEMLSMSDNLLVVTTQTFRHERYITSELADYNIDIIDRPESDSDAMKFINDTLEGFRYWTAQYSFSINLYADGRAHAINLNGNGITEAFVTDPFLED